MPSLSKPSGDKDETRYYLHVDGQRRRIYSDDERDALAVAYRWASKGKDFYVTSETRRVVYRGKRDTP